MIKVWNWQFQLSIIVQWQRLVASSVISVQPEATLMWSLYSLSAPGGTNVNCVVCLASRQTWQHFYSSRAEIGLWELVWHHQLVLWCDLSRPHTDNLDFSDTSEGWWQLNWESTNYILLIYTHSLSTQHNFDKNPSNYTLAANSTQLMSVLLTMTIKMPRVHQHQWTQKL